MYNCTHYLVEILEKDANEMSLLNKINIIIYSENLTIELYILYALNTHVKFCVNRILFTI